VCESGGRRVTRTELDGRITVLAERFEGKRLNSPNDVVVKSDGTVWFSDPDYGILSDYTGTRAESEIGACNVFRYDPADGSLGVACEGLAKPNGLAFSPDERTLYVADSGRTHDPDGPHQIVAFDVAADGRAGRFSRGRGWQYLDQHRRRRRAVLRTGRRADRPHSRARAGREPDLRRAETQPALHRGRTEALFHFHGNARPAARLNHAHIH
jgi:hypothetical protein